MTSRLFAISRAQASSSSPTAAVTVSQKLRVPCQRFLISQEPGKHLGRVTLAIDSIFCPFPPESLGFLNQKNAGVANKNIYSRHSIVILRFTRNSFEPPNSLVCLKVYLRGLNLSNDLTPTSLYHPLSLYLITFLSTTTQLTHTVTWLSCLRH